MARSYAERRSGVSRYLQEIREYQPLSREQEEDVARRIDAAGAAGAGDEAFHELVTSNLRFVVKIANEYRQMGLPYEDLLNEGNLGLIEAAHRFDPAHGAKFVSYAMWWIRKSMLKAISQNASMVHLPEYQQRQVRQARRTSHRLARGERDAVREEISRELGVPVERVDELLRMQLRDLSLDEKVGEEQEATVVDQMVDERAVDAEEEMIRDEDRDQLRRALRRLSRRELTVLVDRYGLEGARSQTLREIGQRLGMSRERVRQIETQATLRLRKVLIRSRRAAKAMRVAPAPSRLTLAPAGP